MTGKRENIEKKIYRVPENYFEDFTDKIMVSISSEKKSGISRLYAIVQPHLILAASMLLLVIVSYSLLKVLLPVKDDPFLIDSYESIAGYLVDEIDEVMLYEEISNIEIESQSDTSPELNLIDEEIIEYLIEENINYVDIIDRF